MKFTKISKNYHFGELGMWNLFSLHVKMSSISKKYINNCILRLFLSLHFMRLTNKPEYIILQIVLT